MWSVANYIYENPDVAGVLDGIGISVLFIFFGLIGKAVSESRMQ